MRARLKTIPCFAAAVLLAGCSADKPLELPAAPVDRAASCAVVAAAQARTKTADFKAPLPLEALGWILHYAMLAASEGEAFDAQVASAVSKRMGELEAGITKGKWQALIPACDAAYPVAAKTDVELPAGRTDALLQCNEVARFQLGDLDGQNAAHANRLTELGQLKQKLDRDIVPGLRARAGTSPAAQQKEKRAALAAATSLGSPVPLLDACMKRFG